MCIRDRAKTGTPKQMVYPECGKHRTTLLWIRKATPDYTSPVSHGMASCFSYDALLCTLIQTGKGDIDARCGGMTQQLEGLDAKVTRASVGRSRSYYGDILDFTVLEQQQCITN